MEIKEIESIKSKTSTIIEKLENKNLEYHI